MSTQVFFEPGPAERFGTQLLTYSLIQSFLHFGCLQVRVLSGQLRDAQNLLITKDRAAAVAAAAAGLKGGAAVAAGLGDPAAAVAAQHKAAELTRELCRFGVQFVSSGSSLLVYSDKSA
jgi:hypothetical protein